MLYATSWGNTREEAVEALKAHINRKKGVSLSPLGAPLALEGQDGYAIMEPDADGSAGAAAAYATQIPAAAPCDPVLPLHARKIPYYGVIYGV